VDDNELNQLLQSARIPERPTRYWAEFPEEVIRRLRREAAEARAEPRKVPVMVWAIGFATACVVIGFVVGSWHGHRRSYEGESLAANAKLIHEVAALFPNRVRAVISDDSGMRLVLSEQADVPVSAPLFLKVCDGKNCQRIITFSGQEVHIGGKSFEVLADAQGAVMLVGSQGFWTSAEPGRSLANLKFEAKVLEAAL